MHPLFGELQLLSSILQRYDEQIIPVSDYAVIALIMHYIRVIQIQLSQMRQ